MGKLLNGKNNKMVKIREVNISDWDDLRGLLEYLVHERPPVALELEPLLQKGEEWIRQFPKGNLGYFVVAQKDGKIVGFCYLAVPKFYNPIAYIGIAVAKSERKHDIGSMLFYEVASWAAMERLQYIFADIWHWNTSSLHFFENLGFVEKERFEAKFKGEDKEKIRLVKKL
jgi:RimJ/RimL family protein N-acetyltransferase